MSGTIRLHTCHWIILGLLAALFMPATQAFAYQDSETQAAATDEAGAAGDQSDAAGDEATSSSTIASSGLPMIGWIIPILGALGLAFTFWKSSWVAQQEVGTDKMARIADNISDGAMSFLRAEYSILFIFVIAVAALLGWSASSQTETSSPFIAMSFGLGALCSALAGFIGMKVATKANVRTTNAARTGLGQALEVAFAGGSVMGMGVVGLGVLGLSILFIVYSNMFSLDDSKSIAKVITVLTGFSFGASSIALFARVGGGIYTQGGGRRCRLGRKSGSRNSRRPSTQSRDNCR